MKASLDCDVLVVGGGTAALCAAIAAARHRASVILCEWAPRELRGGNTRHSRNFRICHDGPLTEVQGRYDASEFHADLHTVSGGQVDRALAELLVDGSRDLPQWLAEAGVRFQLPSGGLLPFSRKTAFLLGGGKAMINALYAQAAQLGVRVLYDTEVTSLPLHGGEAEAVQAGEALRIRHGAAVVCSGGYQADLGELERHWGPAARNFHVRGTPFATGRLFRNLLDQGAAAVGEAGACHLVAVDARSIAVDGGIVTRVLGMPWGVVVDQRGERFHNEGAETGQERYSAWGQRLARCAGQTAYLILDAAGERRGQVALDAPVSAASIAELAAKLDLPQLPQTVELYNAAAAQGRAGELSPPKSRFAAPLIEPPFSAYPMRPGVTFTCHGLRIDSSARVVRSDGGVCPSLFAAGVVMAPNLLGTGYLAGASLTIGMVFGRLAGTEAARHVRG